MISAVETPSSAPRTYVQSIGAVNNSGALVVGSGDKLSRMSQKDFFAMLPPSVIGRAAKVAAYRTYCNEYSSALAGELMKGVASGTVELSSVKPLKSGKGGTIAFKKVEKAPEAIAAEQEAKRLADEN